MGSEASSVHSVPVSHEVEAVSLSSEGMTVKQTSRRAASELILSTLLSGTRYQAGLRSIKDFEVCKTHEGCMKIGVTEFHLTSYWRSIEKRLSRKRYWW